ncbi:MAG: ankyrin repeat domain-containing protein [Blastocatellia bacterium]
MDRVPELTDAAFYGDLQTVVALLERSPDGVNCRGPAGLTPLMHAIMGGHVETMIVLMEAGADVNLAAEDGSTALLKACLWSLEDVVELLIAYHADVNARDIEGWTALKIAIQRGNSRIVAMLERAGANQ